MNQVFNEMGELNNNTLWSQVTARVDDNITVIPINFDGNLWRTVNYNLTYGGDYDPKDRIRLKFGPKKERRERW